MMRDRQVGIILFEGTDSVGKTTLAKAVARHWHIPYYKNTAEERQKLAFETKLLAQYVCPIVIDLFAQLRPNIVMDRFYPSEFVYGQVLPGRTVDLDQLRTIDTAFAQLDPILVFCYKTTYSNFVDVSTQEQFLSQLRAKYCEFLQWTSIRNVVSLDMTTEDLQTQLQTLSAYIYTRLKSEEWCAHTSFDHTQSNAEISAE